MAGIMANIEHRTSNIQHRTSREESDYGTAGPRPTGEQPGEVRTDFTGQGKQISKAKAEN